MLGISEAAEAIGFRTQGVRITVEELEGSIRWEQKKHMNHKGLEENVYCISWDVPADPAAEKRTCRFRVEKILK